RDKPGIVAAIAGFLSGAGANIVRSDQHSTDPWDGMFFARLEFALPDAVKSRADFAARFAEEAGDPLGMRFALSYADQPKRVAILVSREDHCLLDLLWRWRRSELGGEVVLVASNHPHHRDDVEGFGLPYHHVQVERDRREEAEERLLGHLQGAA